MMLSTPGGQENLKQFRKQSVLDIRKLNTRWLDEMTHSDAQLREKMALFWHGHFATKTVNIIYDQQLLDIIRRHALGNFRELLYEVSHSASMIHFLNNNQNRKDHPNENFARELMELFTLGRGHYTETDVKESARAFTGWTTSFRGDFQIRERQHDEGIKTFLGKTGNLTGDNILEVLLGKRETAVFLSTKIYRFFVNDQVNERRVNELADLFFQSGYDIQKLLKAIFLSDWFYDPENIGVQIKSPVVWMVGMRRQLDLDITNPDVQILVQRLLGQVLFNPPNVAGWPGGKHWIDSSSLMFRLRLPQLVDNADAITLSPKDDDDLMMGNATFSGRRRSFTGGDGMPDNRRNAQFIHAKVNWQALAGCYQDIPDQDLPDALAATLLQYGPTGFPEELKKFTGSPDRDGLIRSAVIRCMTAPEYQLC